MAVETYGSWNPAALSVMREVSKSRSAYSGGTLSQGDAFQQILTTLNVTLMRTQARMLVLRLPPVNTDPTLVGYGKEE